MLPVIHFKICHRPVYNAEDQGVETNKFVSCFV